MFLWFYRQHNAIARQLQVLNPCWDDDKLFYTAREINIAYANQIFYYEYLPNIMGKSFLPEREEKGGFISLYIYLSMCYYVATL